MYYELTVLFKPELVDNLEQPLRWLRKIIDSIGMEIVKEENDGLKRLAYEIQNNTHAVYYFLELKTDKDGEDEESKKSNHLKVLKLSNHLNIADQVLRYLLVKEDIRK